MSFKYLIIATLFIASSCQRKESASVKPVEVTAMKITPQTVPAVFEYVGIAESSHIVELRARVEGYLEEITYVEGTLVHKGDLMFVLDQRPFQAALDEAKGELARQESILWNAKVSKDRMVPLYEKNAVSERDLDDAIAKEMASEASVLSAAASVEKAAINLGYASIPSPVTGMASNAKFREGALISPGPNSLLTNIYVVDPIWVNFSLSEGDILQAREEAAKNILKLPDNKDFKIKIVMPDNTVLPAEGKVDFTAPNLQQNTGTMLVRTILPNPDGWLMPGQFVRVKLYGATYPQAIVVPQTAVLTGQKGQFVFVINDKQQSEIKAVTTGDWYENDYWLIQSGLKEGDIVVTQGVNKLQNNVPVTVKTWITPDFNLGSEQLAESTFVYDFPLLH